MHICFHNLEWLPNANICSNAHLWPHNTKLWSQNANLFAQNTTVIHGHQFLIWGNNWAFFMPCPGLRIKQSKSVWCLTSLFSHQSMFCTVLLRQRHIVILFMEQEGSVFLFVGSSWRRLLDIKHRPKCAGYPLFLLWSSCATEPRKLIFPAEFQQQLLYSQWRFLGITVHCFHSLKQSRNATYKNSRGSKRLELYFILTSQLSSFQ